MRTCPTTLVQKGETVSPQSLLSETAHLLDRPRRRGRFTRFTVVKLVLMSPGRSFKQQPLLLVSLDGLRSDYMQSLSSLLPVLGKLSECR